MPLSQKAKLRIAWKRKTIKQISEAIKKRRTQFVKQRMFTQYPSVSTKEYQLYGRNFFRAFPIQEFGGGNERKYFILGDPTGSYESNREIVLLCNFREEQKTRENTLLESRPKLKATAILGHLAIGFEKDAIIIEAIKGPTTTNGKQKYRTLLNEFWRITKQKPLEKMLQEAENHAKSLGFKEIKIRRPETLCFYENPFIESDKPLNEIRANMKILYGRIAKNRGYTKEEFYYVKKL
jgi:hypothetical protein